MTSEFFTTVQTLCVKGYVSARPSVHACLRERSGLKCVSCCARHHIRVCLIPGSFSSPPHPLRPTRSSGGPKGWSGVASSCPRNRYSASVDVILWNSTQYVPRLRTSPRHLCRQNNKTSEKHNFGEGQTRLNTPNEFNADAHAFAFSA